MKGEIDIVENAEHMLYKAVSQYRSLYVKENMRQCSQSNGNLTAWHKDFIAAAVIIATEVLDE